MKGSEMTTIKAPAPRQSKQRQNLNLKLAADIGAEIVSGRLPVGSLIPSEPELCAKYGVSRTVVREAVKLLSSKGLLRTGSGTGTWVLPTSDWNFLDPTVFAWVRDSDDSERAIAHLFAFRSAVEPAAAAEAARNARLEQLYAIESALEVMTDASNDFQKWIEGDIAFHTALYIASNNVFMAPLANLFRQYFQMSFRVSSSNQHHQHCLQEHRDVFEAIRRHDPEEAARTVRILLDHATDDVSAVLASMR
jgi:GntR family transcriptional regulator, galactonate operon transcriptional repressor